jgi:hypothetical protein
MIDVVVPVAIHRRSLAVAIAEVHVFPQTCTALLTAHVSGCCVDTPPCFCSPFLLGKKLARCNLQYITTSQLRRKASAKKARKGPSTHVIGDTSFVKIAIDSKKAEVSSNFSSYQMLAMDNDFMVKLRANKARK